MKNLIKKTVALLALVGLAAAPSTGWATTWVTTLSVAVNGEGGTVTVSNGGTQTSTSGSLTSSATHTYTITATANDTYSFVGWFTDGSDTPFSTAAQTTRDVKVTSTSYDSRTGSLTKGYTYTKSGGTLYAKFAQHTHKITYSINGDTITKSCTADGCPGGVGGTATLTANGATYDGKTHAASVAKTGDVSAELTYSCGSAPTAADTYEVTMKVDGGTAANTTLTKSFTILPASITAVTLNATSFNYDGTDKTTFIKSVKAGSLTPGAGDYGVSGDPMTQVGSLTEKKTYTVTVTGKGNYTGSASASWTINNPSGSFKDDALKPSAGCAANGNTVTVNDSAKLVYANGKWYASMTIELPNDQSKDGSYVQGATFVNAANTRVEYKGATYTGSQIQGGAVPELTAPAETPVDYKYGWIYEQRTYKYLPSITYTMELTPEIITAAKAEGKIEDSVTVYALAWKDNQDVDGTFGCETGLKPTTYTLTVPIDDNLKLFDENNQVYPELPYIANIGAKKFLNLADALGAATAGQTVEVFGDAAVESGLVVPVGVTLNLGAHGNAESSYVLTGAQLNNDAKVVSTVKLGLAKFSAKGDGVADNFFKVVETEDSGTYTYALELNHEHLWGDFELNGNVLTAKCTNKLNTCTYEDGTVSITLNAEGKAWDGDDSAVSPTLSGKEAFEALLKDGEQHAVTIGALTVEHPAYSTDKWLTGAYTAKCTVTIDGVDYELTQAFEITKPEGGYTSGFEALGIGGYDVRFGSLAEAASATTNGATIYYRGGNWNAGKFIASPSKDITLDLGGKTLTCQEAQKSVDGFILENTGAGTVTLVNGVIDQPYGHTFAIVTWVKGAKQVTVNGKFVFGKDLSAKNEADSDSNNLTITADNLKVEDGAYQAKFAGTVEISGGKFWSEAKPTALATDHIVREIDGDYKYQVVEHHHAYHYEGADKVITATCEADDHEFCGFGTQTLTLNAKDEKVSGKPYSSASIAYSDGFPKKDAVITFWKGDEPVVGDLTVTGDYVAKVTVGGATAEATFKIFHEHEYKIEQTDDVTLTATCQAGGTCDAPTRTLKLVAESRDWQKGTVFAASLEDGFDEEIAYTVSYVYKQDGETIAAPKLTGEYTVEATVTIAETPYVLTKAFSITKPTGGYTAGYEVKGADGEESKWLCYDTFADAVAAAEEKGTVVWHEGGDNLRQATFDFKSDKDITVDLNGKNFSYDSDGHVTIKNSGSGRVKLINGTLRTAGTITSWSHDIYLQGKLTLGEGISVVKYGDLSSAGLNIREGADIILAGGTYRGTLEVDANAKLAITGGKYNTYYSSAMTTYVPDRGDKYVVRSISEDSGNLIYYVVPHEHEFKTSASGNVLTVKCEGTDSNLCNFGKGATIKLTAGNALADGTTYAGVSVDNQVTGDWAAKLPDAAAVSLADIVYYAAEDESTPLEGAPKDAGDYVVTLTYDGQTARATFSILPADISTGTFELNWETIAYDGQPHENDIKTAKIGETPIVLGRDFEVSGDFTQTGSPAEDCTYKVTLTGIGNFKGTKELSWTITTLGDTDKFGTPETINGDYGTITERTMTITVPTKMVYGNNAWAVGMKVTVPTEGWTVFTPVEFLYFESPKTEGVINGADADTLAQYGLVLDTDDISYSQYKKYVKSFNWIEAITPLQIEEALRNGDDKIVRTLKAYVLSYTEKSTSFNLNFTNNGGLREVEFKMEIPLAGLVLPVPAGATLDMAGTKFASEDEYEDYPYQLQLGAGAKVYGDPEVDGGYIFNEDGLTTTVEGYEVTYVEIEDAQEGECAYYFTTLPINYNIGYSFVDTDGNTLTDVTNPYSGTKTYTVEDEVTFTEPATLDGYEFVGWSPAKIEKGSTGKQTITGTFKRSITPTAQVAEVTPAPEGLDVAATFTLGEYAANYRDWKADFILTADQNLAKDAITLKGEIPSQTTGWVPLALADDYTAGTPLSIIGLAMEKLPLALPVYYWELKDMGTFNCGLVANKIETETKVTVSLVLSKEGEDPMTLATFETTLQKTSTPYEDVVIDDTDDGKTVEPEVKQAAAAKVESLCGGDVANIAAVKAWVLAQGVKAADLAESIYTKASYDLGVALLDKGESVAKVAFDEVVEDSANGFSFKIEVQFEGEPTPEVVKATAAKVAGYIWTTGDLGKGFTSAIDASRVEIDLVTGKVTIKPDASKTSEFFKIVIPRD